ncbi:MAG TPA: hypothetical protein VMT53_12045, partial [Terriglobales bacterium]|nr:hypothetical protein [Terriglobales bacterium]
SGDAVMWKGVVYRYVNACTFVDVCFGSVPLLWNIRHSLVRNLSFMGTVALGMFCFNVCRLSFSDILFAAGVPWDVAHNVISGISYFLVWVWIWRHVGQQ